MKQVSIDQLSNNLDRYLEIAGKDDVIITRQGEAVGLLIGLEASDDWWEELLLRHPQFRDRLDRAKKHLREGKGTTLEDIRAKYNLD